MTAIVWWEVESPDPETFQEFHASLWGWTFRRAFQETELGADYWVVRAGEVSIGGLQRGDARPQAGVRLYLQVADLEATLGRARALGATVERRRVELGGDDRWFATFLDPTGVSFGLWTENPPRRAQVRLRPATALDVPHLERITTEAYRHYEPLIGRRPAPMLADLAGPVRDQDVWVALEDGEIVGLIVMSATGPEALHVDSIAVLPASQGHGIGAALLDLAENRAARRGLGAVTLYTNQAMVENLAWYGRRGFVETGRRQEGGFARVHLRKTLP
jgi:predicted enzyme related to lactoylglutathione lyase/ribosomal protein S18 acetylase RimI-like enzyme